MIKRVRRIKQDIEPGAVHAVPLPSGGFAYLKLLFAAPWRDVARLYDIVSKEMLSCAEVLASGTLVEQLIIAGSGIQSGDWPRIGFEPIASPEDATEGFFVMGLPPTQQVRRMKDNSVVRSPTPHDLDELPHAILHNQHHFERLLKGRRIRS